MANLQIPSPSNNKRPTNVYEWLGFIQKVMKETKGIDWHLQNTLNIKQLGDSIGNDRNFVQTVDNKIAESHKPVELSSTADLNTLTETGLFSGGFDSESSTILNRPNIPGSFILRVYKVVSVDGRARTIQILYCRRTGDSYTRLHDETTGWSQWIRALKQTDVSVNADANKLVIRDANGNIKVNTIIGSLQGNSDSTTKLKTPRKINGTNFDGTQDITTANWGTARNFTIGKTSKSVNGSTNMSWTLDEMGALPTAGGTMTGSIRFSGGGYSGPAIQMEAGDGNGAYIGVGAGGLTIIGSGESTGTVRSNISNGSVEQMIVASDNDIIFNTNLQNGYETRKTVTITSAGVVDSPQGFKGALNGNASTATKLATARNIALGGAMNGSASFDGSSNITINTNRQSITVGTETDGLVQWYLVASKTMAENSDAVVMFSVNSTYSIYAGGILRLHVRSSSTGTLSNMTLDWLVNTGLDINHFVIVCDNTTWKLFAKTTKRWQYLDFTVISMNSRTRSISTEVSIPSTIQTFSDLPTGTVEYSKLALIQNTSTEANKLNSFYSRRQSSLDIAAVGDGSLTTFKATSENHNHSSYPGKDGHILHFEWDNDAGWSSQLFLGASSDYPIIKTRAMKNHAWGEWNTFYSTHNKPTPSEIGAAPSSHTHTSAQISDATASNNANTVVKRDGNGNFSAGTITATLNGTANYSKWLAQDSSMTYGWNGVNYFNINGTAGNAAKVNDTPTTAWWHIMRFNHRNNSGFYTDLAIPFNTTSLYYKRITSGSVQNGGWVKVLDALNYNEFAPTKTGGGASGSWGISVTGNASTATKLQTARSINGTNFDGTANITTANWGTARNIQIGNSSKSVNGSGNVTWSHSEMGVLPTSGGTMTGSIRFSGGGYSGPAIQMEAGENNTGAYIGIGAGGLTVIGSGESTAAVRSNLPNGASEKMVIASDEEIIFYSGLQNGYGSRKTVTITSAGVVDSPQGFKGALNGNASTANKLQTARTINGTTFDGTANITTANWGTTRTLTIGNSGKSVNGSGNVSWSLSEIGAAAASHTHDRISSGNNLIQVNQPNDYAGLGKKNNVNIDTWYGFSISNKCSGQSVAVDGVAFSVNARTGEIYTPAKLTSSIDTGTHLSGANGKAIINSTSNAEYVVLAKAESKNGKFTLAKWTTRFVLNYIANTSVSANKNEVTKQLVLLHENGNSDFPGTVTAPTFKGALTGNASTATTLQTARTINGTSFNGSGNITTANWGTARTITIGSAGKSVNGSGNVSWSLSEIGAVPLSTGGNITIHADSDASTTNEYLMLKAGHNELKITTSGGGSTVTKGQDKLTFNGNVVYHAGKKPTPADIGAAPSSHTHSSLKGASGGNPISSSVSTGYLQYNYGIDRNTTGLFPWVSNANGLLTINKHEGNYYSQLGFSSNGKLYYRNFEGAALNTTTGWSEIAFTSSVVNAANKLATARSINGTNFDGTGNITTANWGTARNIQIGNTTRSVNGSGNYAWSLADIGAAASNHNHGLLHDNLTVSIASTTTDSGWSMINSSYNGFILKSIRANQNAPAWLLNNYAAGIAFGGSDTKGVMSVSYNGAYVRFAGGNGTKPVWNFTLKGTSGRQYDLDIVYNATNANNANTVVKRDGNGNFSAGTISASLNGTANYSKWLAQDSSMTYGWNGVNYFNINGTAGNAAKVNDTPTTAWWHIMRFNHRNNSGFYTDLAIPFNTTSLYYKRITSGSVQNGGWVKVLDALNYNEFAPTKTGGGASGSWGISVTGNASTATKLQTARSINGTNFDGTGNITTANWGTARNIQIGNTTRSVNGSGNYTWSHADIGTYRIFINHEMGGSQTNITTAQFLTLLEGKGAFSQASIFRGTWSYAGNNIITDTACGNIHLAGALIEVVGRNKNECTIRVHTATTSSNGGMECGDFIYVNNGSDYNPGWRRLYNTRHKPSPADIGAAPSSHTHTSAQISDATASNNANTVVKRDGSGNFNAGRITLSNWIYCSGNTGIYFNTHGGGWYMTDSTWLRAYGDKSIYTKKDIKADGKLYAGSAQINGGMNATGWVSGSGITSGGGWYEVTKGEAMKLRSGSGNIIVIPAEGTSMVQLYPNGNNAGNLGTADMRWSRIYTVNGMNQSSDSRYKTNIETVNTSDCFEMIKNIDVYTYILLGEDKRKLSRQQLIEKTEENKNNIEIGVIAQDIAKFKYGKYIVEKGDSSENEDSFYAISPYNLTSATIAALKEEINLRESLESKVETLESEIQELKSLVAQLLNK